MAALQSACAVGDVVEAQKREKPQMRQRRMTQRQSFYPPSSAFCTT